MVEEVSDKADVRRSSPSFLSRTAPFRRPALTVLALGAAAIIVVLAFTVLAHPLRRRRRR